MLDVRKDIDFFEKGIFAYKSNAFKTKEEESEEESKEESKIHQIYWEWIKDYKLWFGYNFNFAAPSALVTQSYETKNVKKNNGLVNVIKSGLSDLKDEIKKMSEDEKEI